MLEGITRNSLLFCNSILDLVRSVDVPEEKINIIQPKLTVLVQDFTTRMDQVDKEQAAQKELTNALIKKVGLLEKQVKKSVMSDRRNDFNLVKDNLIVRTRKNIGEVQKCIIAWIEKGGGGKIAPKNIPVVEIKNETETGRRGNKIFRATLEDGHKKFLFSGLAKTNPPVQDIRIENECPAFLVKTKRQFERISFSLRSKFKETNKIKVKLALIGLKMRIKIKDKDNSTWIGLDDAKAKEYMDTEVFFSPEDIPAGGIPTIRDFYTKAIASLE